MTRRAAHRLWPSASRVVLGCASLACAGITLAAQAQAPALAAPGATPAASGRQRFVAIGCVSRQPASGRGAAAKGTYILTDTRGEQPTLYRLDGDDSTLAFHVGHMVEVTGAVTAAPAGRGANRTGPMLKVGALTYISRTCSTTPATD